jgi:hypothetical protein
MCARTVRGLNPRAPKEHGRFLLCGKDLNHCGEVMWRKLVRPGAFKIIRGPDGAWRAFRPHDPWDAAHAARAKPAPPLLPTNLIKGVAWEDKKSGIPRKVLLHNGWELLFFSSVGEPRQGIDVDAAWFDEEIDHPSWYTETSARIIDRKGFFYWTATPQAGTQHLYDLHCRAHELEAAGVEDPPVREFHLTLLENPHLGEKEKRDFAAKLSADEYRIRVLGDFALLGTRVYAEFAPRGPHGCDAFPIPSDWTRYIAVDPGRQVCAVLFAAVPPPGSPHAGRVFLYDELYIRQATAARFAEELRRKLGDQVVHKAIIDMRAGRITEIGSGVTHEEQYRRALAQAGVFRPGHLTGFTWSTASGGDDVRAGIEAVRAGLHLDAEGRSKWVVFRDSCPMLLWEAERYSYKKLPSGIVTDEPIKANDHLIDCWRYLAMARLPYRRPAVKPRAKGYTTDALEAKRRRERARGRDPGWGDSIRLG